MHQWRANVRTDAGSERRNPGTWWKWTLCPEWGGPGRSDTAESARRRDSKENVLKAPAKETPMPYENITLERRDGVATLTLNRPKAANSIDIPLARELMDAAIVCDDDPETRAVILTGAGPMFLRGRRPAFVRRGGPRSAAA